MALSVPRSGSRCASASGALPPEIGSLIVLSLSKNYLCVFIPDNSERGER